MSNCTIESKVLYIRSSSLQHTPVAVEAIKSYGIQRENMDILTHKNMEKSLVGFRKMFIYPFNESFSASRILVNKIGKELRDERYQKVIVPVENISGIGYENVLLMVLLLFPKQIIVVNKNGEFKEYSLCMVAWQVIKKYLYVVPAAMGTIVFFFLWTHKIFWRDKK